MSKRDGRTHAADLQDMRPKPKTSLTWDSLGCQPAKEKGAATPAEQRNEGAHEADLPWGNKTRFRSAAPQKRVRDHIHLFKKQYIFFKIGICSFGVSSPAIHIQG